MRPNSSVMQKGSWWSPSRGRGTLLIVGALLLACLVFLKADLVQACCGVGPRGMPVVNADQSVIMIWDAEKKMQHFIRQASFKSEANNFGFLVPSPSQPELSESGNEAFAFLQMLTTPIIPADNSKDKDGRAPKSGAAVKVLERKLVAGFDAAVLETKSADALVEWLKKNGYVYSPEIKDWAKPYVEAGWKITALKVAKDKDARKGSKDVAASALRMSFKTDRPLFPYREPDYKDTAKALGAKNRLLRIYFIAEARYQGELTKESAWTGNVVWAGKIDADSRKKTLEMLKLPETTGPAEWFLTKFDDNWPYKVAPADVYFTKSKDQSNVIGYAPATPQPERRVADVYRQLFQERMTNIERLRKYHERGMFPRNYEKPVAVPVFVDVHGTHCAVGQLVKESGATDLVRQVVKLDNNIYVNDVKDGPFLDWILWSGLTQEECSRVQPRYRPRPPTDYPPVYPPVVPPPDHVFVPPLPLSPPIGSLEPDDRLTQEHLARVEKELKANTFSSLEKAMVSLRARNKELFVGKNFAVVAPPTDKTDKATLTLKNVSKSQQIELALTFFNSKGEVVRQEIPRFQSHSDFHRRMMRVSEEIQVPYNCQDTWVVAEWTTGPELKVTVPFRTVVDAKAETQAKK